MEALRAGLLAIKSRLAAQLPDPILENLQKSDSSQTPIERTSTVNAVLSAFRTLEWRSRVRLGFGLVFPSPEYIRTRYCPTPDWLWPLFHPYRWAQMLAGGEYRHLD